MIACMAATTADDTSAMTCMKSPPWAIPPNRIAATPIPRGRNPAMTPTMIPVDPNPSRNAWLILKSTPNVWVTPPRPREASGNEQNSHQHALWVGSLETGGVRV